MVYPYYSPSVDVGRRFRCRLCAVTSVRRRPAFPLPALRSHLLSTSAGVSAAGSAQRPPGDVSRRFRCRLCAATSGRRPPAFPLPALCSHLRSRSASVSAIFLNIQYRTNLADVRERYFINGCSFQFKMLISHQEFTMLSSIFIISI